MSNNLPRNVFTTCSKKETSRIIVPKDEFKIYNGAKVFGPDVLMIVKGAITFEHIEKAAKCGNYERYYITKMTDDVPLFFNDLPIKHNIIIKPSKVKPPKVDVEYKIFDGPSGRELMICKNKIIIDDAKKAVKCAGLKPFEVYATMTGSTTVKLTGGNYPVYHDIVIWKIKSIPKRKPEVFHICESTSVAPVRTPVKKIVPTPVLFKVSAKRKLIKAAIKGLQHAIEALYQLEAIAESHMEIVAAEV